MTCTRCQFHDEILDLRDTVYEQSLEITRLRRILSQPFWPWKLRRQQRLALDLLWAMPMVPLPLLAEEIGRDGPTSTAVCHAIMSQVRNIAGIAITPHYGTGWSLPDESRQKLRRILDDSRIAAE